MKKICIYKITNPKGKVYIGQTVNFYLREVHYRKRHAYKQKKLFASFGKYGYENHTIEVIEECGREELNDREKHWISYYNSFKNGLNLTTGGDSKYKLSDESKRNLSESKKGNKNPMYGKKSWISGRKMDEEHCKKLSEAHKGKMLGSRNGFFKGYVNAYKDGLLIGTYEGINDASRKLGIARENISKVVRGLRLKAGGYTFTR